MKRAKHSTVVRVIAIVAQNKKFIVFESQILIAGSRGWTIFKNEMILSVQSFVNKMRVLWTLSGDFGKWDVLRRA